MTDRAISDEKYESLTTQEIYKKPRLLVCDKDKAFLEWIAASGQNMLCEFVTTKEKSKVLLEASRKEFSGLILGVSEEGESKAISFLNEVRSLSTNKNIPALFVLDEGMKTAKIKAEKVNGALILQKPIGLDKLANAIGTLISDSFEQYRALVVSESPQSTARLASRLERANIESKFVLRPQRVLEFLYDFEPDMLLVDTELFAINPNDLCKSLRNSSRWDNMAILLFSSKGKDIDHEKVAQWGADDALSLDSEGDSIGDKAKAIGKRTRATAEAAGRDFLTGLCLRDRLYDKYIPQLEDPDSVTTNLTFAWLDIAKLKAINDTYGHSAGDRVLVTLSSFLHQRLNHKSALVCRWAGDEIVIVVKGLKEEAESEIKNAVLDFSLIKIPNLDKNVRVCAGIAHFPEDGKTVDELLDLANWRLHKAKKATSNVCSS